MVSADSSPSALSYEANGACYCTNAVTSSIVAGTIQPTPVGGQTIAQICSRIGSGPGLQIDNGKYNFPAFGDAQCGHGLSTRHGENSSEENCLGLSASGDSVCGTTGPRWDLAQAFSDKPSQNSNAIKDENNIASTAAEPDTAAKKSASTIVAIKPAIDSDSEKVSVAQEMVTAEESVSDRPVQSSAKVAAIAEQLRAFNQSVQGSLSNAGSRGSSDADTTTKPTTLAAAHSGAAKTHEMTEPTQKVVRGGVSEPYTLDSRKYQELHQQSVTASTSKPLEPTPEYLTQEDIATFPEATTEPVPNLITYHSAELVVTAEQAQPGITTVIVIEPDGSPRQMTQEEIMKLPLLVEDDQVVTETLDQEQSANNTTEPDKELDEPTVAAAIVPPAPTVPNLPTSPFKRSRLDYSYVGIAPTNYDFGGAGAEIDASLSRNNGFALIGNAAAAEEYTEASVGLGFFFAPFPHQHTDFVFNVGAEFGSFDLGITDLDDAGGFIGAFLRTRPIPRIELTGGARYSSFFEGDAMFVATGIFSITRELNLFGKVEVGDNDQFSLGFRYFY